MATISVTINQYISSSNKIKWEVEVEGLDSNDVERRIQASINNSGSITPATAGVSGDGNYEFWTNNPIKGTTYTATFRLQWKSGTEGWKTAISTNASVSVPADKPVISSLTASSDRGTKSISVSWSASNVSGGTYAIYVNGYSKKTGSATTSGNASIPLDHYYQSCSVKMTITTSAGTAEKSVTNIAVKPAKFSWTNKPIAGQDFNMLGSDWKQLQVVINNARDYLGQSAYDFATKDGTTSYSGKEFDHNYFNHVREALRIGEWGRWISEVDRGDPIKAAYFDPDGAGESIVAVVNSMIA